VEELNIRLMGFGNTIQHPAPLDEFTAATERAVKQFQRDYMGVAESGKACRATLAAIDELRKKYPLSYNGLACQCRNHNPGAQRCHGLGMARTGSSSIGYLKNGKNVAGVERPGIHRALFWSLRTALFYLAEKEPGLGFRFSHISSGYRCWKRAKQMGIFSTNHLGSAVDLHFERISNGSHVDGSALDSLKTQVFVSRMRARPKWDTPNRISLEPTSMTDRWVHMDVREFRPAYRLDRHYAKDREAADGDDLIVIAKREAMFGLLACRACTAPAGIQARADSAKTARSGTANAARENKASGEVRRSCQSRGVDSAGSASRTGVRCPPGCKYAVGVDASTRFHSHMGERLTYQASLDTL